MALILTCAEEAPGVLVTSGRSSSGNFSGPQWTNVFRRGTGKVRSSSNQVINLPVLNYVAVSGELVHCLTGDWHMIA